MSTNSLDAYLKTQKQAFLSLPSSRPPKVTLVSGNESGDLDSLVCALSVAYALGSGAFPIVQTRAKDLSLRPENILALQTGNVDPDDVLNLDDVEKTLSELKGTSVDVVLVDHNRLTGNLTQFDANVIAILDHHMDEGLYCAADPRVIFKPQECASCSSLITRALRQGWLDKLTAGGKARQLDSDIARLLLSASLIDTHNLDAKIGKAKPVDHESAGFLSPLADVPLASDASRTVTISALDLKNGTQSPFDATHFYQALSQAKNDVTGLDTIQLLTRDYKQYSWNGPNGTTWQVGLGTVPESLEGWVSREGKTKFLAGCKEFSQERDIDLLGILTTFVASGTFQRELAIYAPEGPEAFQQFAHVTEKGSKDSLSLEPLQKINDALNGDNLIHVWQQRQTRSTRKQVAPAFQDFASKVTPPRK